MKKLILFSMLAVFNYGYSQLFVSPGEEVTVLSNTLVYTNEDVNNQGIITFGESDFMVDSNFDNTGGAINYNDVTLFMGNGGSNNDADVIFKFKDRDVTTQIGDEVVKYVVLNKNGFEVEVTEGHLAITETLELESGNLEGTERGGVVTLINRSLGDAAQVVESNAGSAKIEVERFTRDKRSFVLYSSGVESSENIRSQLQEGASGWQHDPFPGFGTHITGVQPEIGVGFDAIQDDGATQDGQDGFDWQPSGDASMFVWSNANQEWSWIDNTNVNTLELAKPYRIMVRGDRSLDIRYNNAEPKQTVLRSRGAVKVGPHNAPLAQGAFNISFVANPYVANVDYSALQRSGLTDFLYVWDASINVRGGLVSVDLSDNTPTPAGNANQYLMPGQAFIVQNTDAGSSSLTFNENNKATNEPANETFSISNYFNLRLQTQGQNHQVIDGVGLRFNDTFSESVDEQDAIKLENPDTNFAIINGFSLLSIEKRPLPNGEVTIPLLLNGYQTENYEFVADMILDGYDVDLYLKDNYLNELIPIENQQPISFNVDASIPESINPYRFEIVLNPTTLSVDNFESVEFTLYPNPAEDVVSIALPNSNSINEQWNLSLYTINGKLLKSWTQDSSDGTISFNVDDLTTGVYLIELSDNEIRSTQKLIKK